MISIKNAITEEGKNFLRSTIGIFLFKHNSKMLYNEMLKNEKLRDIHQGKRCFVLGNGPSINKQDLTLLANEYVFTVNDFFKHPDCSIIKPNYHLFADPLYYSDECTQMNLNSFSNIKLEESKPIVFFPTDGYTYIKKHNLDEKFNLYYFTARQSFKGEKIEYDYTKFVTGFWTVVQYAITLAIFMGFKEIYLLGCDCTGIVEFCDKKENPNCESEGHFYKEDSSNKNIYDNLTNVDMFEGWTKIFQGYNAVNRFCIKKGILLLNATEGGILDNVPRIKYESLFS